MIQVLSHLRQNSSAAEAVLLLGLLITKIKNEYPTVNQIREHALTLEAADHDSDKAWPGTGMLPMLRAIRNRFEGKWLIDQAASSSLRSVK